MKYIRKFPICPKCGAVPRPNGFGEFTVLSAAYYQLEEYDEEYDYFTKGDWVDGAGIDVGFTVPTYFCETCGSEFDDWYNIMGSDDLDRLSSDILESFSDRALEKIAEIINHNEN